MKTRPIDPSEIRAFLDRADVAAGVNVVATWRGSGVTELQAGALGGPCRGLTPAEVAALIAAGIHPTARGWEVDAEEPAPSLCPRCDERPLVCNNLCAECDCDDHGDRVELEAGKARRAAQAPAVPARRALPAGWRWEPDGGGVRLMLLAPEEQTRERATGFASKYGSWSVFPGRCMTCFCRDTATPRPGQSLLDAAQEAAEDWLWEHGAFGEVGADAPPTLTKPPIVCAFCGKSAAEVRRMIAGNGSYICDECVSLSRDILSGDAELKDKTALPAATVERLSTTPDREALGRKVRDIWIAWAREQAAPKPSWLVPWDGLSEPDREVDRRIGERLYGMGRHKASRELDAACAELAALRASLAALATGGAK